MINGRERARFSVGLVSAGIVLVTVGCGTANPDAEQGAKASSARTLAAGTSVEITLGDSISSRTNAVGNVISASVSQDVLDDKGGIAIPAGSPVTVHISAIAPTDQGDHNGDGVIRLTVSSISVNGVSHDMSAEVNNVPHTVIGRGVTPGVAAKVVGGAAIGAAVGQAIGKNTKSTVVGGAVGAVAGGGAAVAGEQRDIIVVPGTHVSFALTQDMTAPAK